MKIKLLLANTLLILSVYSADAQVIPNYNFETWSNGTSSAPDGWLDHGSKHTGFYPVTQSTDYYLGSYSVHLENKVTGTDTTSGILETERPNNPNGGMGPAFPISTRYATLKGFYKFIPQNGDSAQIFTFLYKTGYVHSQGFGSLLGGGWKNIGAATTVWTPFSTMNFFYDSPTVIPDSAYISLGASQGISFYTGAQVPVKGNSALYVDALNYDSFLTGVNESLDITSNFKIFPNATNGIFDVSFETTASNFTTIKIFDLDGREIMNLFNKNLSSGSHSFHYDATGLNSGTYLLVIASEKGYKAEKLFIQK